MVFAPLFLPSVKNLLKNVSWGSIYHSLSLLSHWVSWIILIIKGIEPASSLEMKPWVIFKSGALNFWWTVTQTEITTIQKSHLPVDREQHLGVISSTPVPSNFLPALLIKTHPFASCFQFNMIMPLTGRCFAGHHLSSAETQGMGIWNVMSYNRKDVHILYHIQY